ncbi:MAG: DUF3006 domain-containing protein [Armatimonadota bacterium]
MKRRAFRAFLDRIEGAKAVLLLGEQQRDTLAIPTYYLPNEAREGQVLRVTIEIDEDGTRSAEQKVASLLRELTGEG